MRRWMALSPRGWKVLGTAVLLLTALPTVSRSASPEDVSESRATLKGVKAVAVLVEKLDPDVEKDGLTRDQLQADVETRLRKAGITVNPSTGESLRVTVKPMKHGAGLYAYAVRVEFHQRVRLSRDSKITASVPTWSVGCLGTVRAEDLRNVRASVADDVDKFVAAYLEQNPRQ